MAAAGLLAFVLSQKWKGGGGSWRLRNPFRHPGRFRGALPTPNPGSPDFFEWTYSRGAAGEPAPADPSPHPPCSCGLRLK